MHRQATFSDGQPITAHDVRFSFEKFIRQGVPQFAKSFDFVREVRIIDEHRLVFLLTDADREKMLSLCTLAVLPKHYWQDKNLAEPLKEIPVSSSGLIISEFKFGQYVTDQKIPDYWAADLPVHKGLGNFSYYRYDYYRDKTVAFEAFKAVDIDIWQENIARQCQRPCH